MTCLFVGATSFFSACANALRMFSRVRLQEELKAVTGQERPDLVEKIAGDADRLVLACGVYRLVFNIGALLLLVALLSTWHGILDTAAGPVHLRRSELAGAIAEWEQAQTRKRARKKT